MKVNQRNVYSGGMRRKCYTLHSRRTRKLRFLGELLVVNWLLMYYSKTCIHELYHKTEETTKGKRLFSSRQIIYPGTSFIQSKYLWRELYLELDHLLQGILATWQRTRVRLMNEDAWWGGWSARGRGFWVPVFFQRCLDGIWPYGQDTLIVTCGGNISRWATVLIYFAVRSVFPGVNAEIPVMTPGRKGWKSLSSHLTAIHL